MDTVSTVGPLLMRLGVVPDGKLVSSIVLPVDVSVDPSVAVGML